MILVTIVNNNIILSYNKNIFNQKRQIGFEDLLLLEISYFAIELHYRELIFEHKDSDIKKILTLMMKSSKGGMDCLFQKKLPFVNIKKSKF